MKTKLTANTDERLFLIHYIFDMGKKDICNLAQIESLIKNSNGIQKIEHLWNGKFKRISKVDLKAMLDAHKLNADFLKLI